MNSELDIDGCVLHRKNRGSRHDGSVAIYIKSSICHESCDSLNIDTNIEAYWLKVKSEIGKSFLVCAMYSPPSASQAYFDYILDNIEAACEVCCDLSYLKI